MSFTVEQKSQLAKLMATENLQVQHRKITSAKFDTKNRVLYLPIWQDMQGFMYDHLTGHEVGHALYTPNEGWHDVIQDNNKQKFYKNFLNVVEDCRIEKKIQRKYPGLSLSFRRGFEELMNRDFFGLTKSGDEKLAFIDKLNIFSKSQWTYSFDFSEQEQKFITKVRNCETWEDVKVVTDEIYEYSKEEQYKLQEEFDHDIENGLNDQYDDNIQESDSNVESEDTQESDSNEESEDTQESDSNEESEDTQESDSNVESEDTQESDSNVESEDTQEFEPRCKTDENFRMNENSLVDEKCKEYLYLNVPKANLQNIITPIERVQEQITEYYSDLVNRGFYTEEYFRSFVDDFKNKNDKYISLLAKEFEMRKAAKVFSKNKLSDTGDIDIGKLAGYKFDDNIFRKMMILPKGKNHGLILLLDCSGSMCQNMAGSIEQILVLALFCRKVNIPFIVYGFGNSDIAKQCDMLIEDTQQYYQYLDSNPCFSRNVNDLSLNEVYLREYLNSNMNNSNFSKALTNMILLKTSYEKSIGRPRSETLSATPLVQAIYAVGQLMPNFRNKFNIDKTSLIIVHDGDSDATNRYCTSDTEKIFFPSIVNVVITDNKNKFQQKVNYDSDHGDYALQIALDWFKKVSHSKVFGFFLTPSSRSLLKATLHSKYVFDDHSNFLDLKKKYISSNYYTNYHEKLDDTISKMKKDKFLISYNYGYDAFYFVLGDSQLMTEKDELKVTGEFTISKLKTAFIRMNKNKQVNRILVSKFIQGISV